MLISFLFFHESICCGYSLEAPHRGASNEYPQHIFSWRNKKNIMWIPPLICSYGYVHCQSGSGKRCNLLSWLQGSGVAWTGLFLTLVLLNKLRCQPTSNFQPIRLLDPDCCYKFTYLMANSADPDQLASSEANWSGSTLFAKAGYIRVQQNKG